MSDRVFTSRKIRLFEVNNVVGPKERKRRNKQIQHSNSILETHLFLSSPLSIFFAICHADRVATSVMSSCRQAGGSKKKVTDGVFFFEQEG